MTRSIDKWHQSGSFCPMCHATLPRKLLRLFFEPQQPSLNAAASRGAVSPRESRLDGGEGAAEKGSASAEVVQLRRELASSTKVALWRYLYALLQVMRDSNRQNKMEVMAHLLHLHLFSSVLCGCVLCWTNYMRVVNQFPTLKYRYSSPALSCVSHACVLSALLLFIS